MMQTRCSVGSSKLNAHLQKVNSFAKSRMMSDHQLNLSTGRPAWLNSTGIYIFLKFHFLIFHSITDQLKNPDFKIVLSVLKLVKSKFVKRWTELDNRITDAANEAKVHCLCISLLSPFLSFFLSLFLFYPSLCLYL